ncbi:MAG: glutamate synthase subunit beta [Bdellovibrionales bacterium]|nr:glutamate synthase subunit beta [Bdellovibrionales bacterium]
MGDIRGFLKYPRRGHTYRPVEERKKDWKEVEVKPPSDGVQKQAGRCMDCGVPFCMSHHGCPLENLIPEWNNKFHAGDTFSAWQALEETNNFPEITGRLCPAPCETSCVAGKDGEPVAIRAIEQTLADLALAKNWIKPLPPKKRLAQSIALIGSGPAGLTAGQQLNRLGYKVSIFEKSPKPGGLLRYGIPNFKYEKSGLDLRIHQLESEGINFRCGIEIDKDISIDQLASEFDVIGLTMGAEQPRDLDLPGRALGGIHFAMEFLVQQNILNSGDKLSPDRMISALNKNVIVIGGGDTGSDCVGTAIRQGAKSVLQLEVQPRPPLLRSNGTPWPQWPMKMRVSHAHEEGGERQWSILTQEFLGNDKAQVSGLRIMDAKTDGSGTEINALSSELKADLVLIAIGFSGPRRQGILDKIGIQLDAQNRPITNKNYQTSIPHIFAAGDVRRGQSLIVWAIAEGRKMAEAIDTYLQTDASNRLTLTR